MEELNDKLKSIVDINSKNIKDNYSRSGVSSPSNSEYLNIITKIFTLYQSGLQTLLTE